MDLLATLAPFVLALVMAAIAPELSGIVRDRVTAVMTEANTRVVDGSAGPPHASVEYVGDYVEYASDAAQALPGLLLPLVGAGLILQGNPLTASTIFLLAFVVPGCTFVFLRVIRADPLTYVARRYMGARYTFLPLAAASINAVAVVVVLLAKLVG
jgi:hypothetical protein